MSEYVAPAMVAAVDHHRHAAPCRIDNTRVFRAMAVE